jgi:hypothetical protein
MYLEYSDKLITELQEMILADKFVLLTFYPLLTNKLAVTFSEDDCSREFKILLKKVLRFHCDELLFTCYADLAYKLFNNATGVILNQYF